MYIKLRGYWCHIISLNVHAPTEDKSDDAKDKLKEESEHIFDQFPKWHIKNMLRNFSKQTKGDMFSNQLL
jgi:hypothetical protein